MKREGDGRGTHDWRAGKRLKKPTRLEHAAVSGLFSRLMNTLSLMHHVRIQTTCQLK